jgi:[acyl-carrier-protein] S-malonyltransferase
LCNSEFFFETQSVSSQDGTTTANPEQIKDALVRQAWHPVRWVETIQAMKAQGVTHVVECGPGKVLTGLIKRIDRDLVALSISDPASLQATLEALEGA